MNIFTIVIWASVPFIGHYDGQTLFCNAACSVSEAGQVIYASNGPINAPMTLPLDAVVLQTPPT